MGRAPARLVQLPLRRAAQIAWRSLRVRAGRSLLTLVTIVLAIAFLTQVWTMRHFEEKLRTTATATPAAASPAPSAEGGRAAAIRTAWLLSLSLLVCVVGITNAMLMNVMERFREIGTMKCLGALDSFILKLFLLESLFLGLAGSLVGVVLGAALTVISLWQHYGGQYWAIRPWPAAIEIGGACLAVGMSITAVAAVYPSWRAARMQPVDAMRVEA